MSLQQALVWVQIGQQLMTVGIATAEQIRTFIKAVHPNLSDADLNAILDTITAGATRHRALADADAQP